MKAFVFFLFVLLLFSGFTCYATQEYKVNVKTVLNVRSAPDSKAALLGTIKNGTRVEVYSISNGWAKIRYGEQEAYVGSDFLLPVNDSNGNNMSYDSSSDAAKEMVVFIILGLSVITFIIRKCTDVDTAEGFLLVVIYLSLLLISVLEIYYSIGLKGDTWFCSSDRVGWIWTIVNFFIFGGVLINQICLFFDVLGSLRYNTSSIDYRTGFYSLGIAIVLGLVAYFFIDQFTPVATVILVLLGGAQLVQIYFIFNSCGSQWGYAIATTVIYLVGIAGILTALIHFIPLLIVALLVWLVLAIIGSGSSSRACRNCRSYDGSYCHYRGEYVSPGSYCKRHEYR